MFVGLGDGNRLLGIGVPSSSVAPNNGIDGKGNINIKTGTEKMTFAMTALTAGIGTPGASGNLTFTPPPPDVAKNKPDKTITINDTEDIPYFILADHPYTLPTDITGAFSIGGFPEDVGSLSANGLVGVVGGAFVDTISTLIYSNGTAIPPLLVTPKDKTAVIGTKKLNIGFKLTTSAEAGFDWGFSRLWFDVTVQAFASGGTASGDYKHGSVWHVSNGLDASYDRGGEANSAGRDILLYIGVPAKVGDIGSEEPIILTGPLDLTYKVPTPVTGGSPVTNFFAGTYSGTVEWTPFASGLFEAGKEYTAAVTLYPAPGYVFPESGVTIIHSGASQTIEDFEYDGGDPGTVARDIAFDKTGDAATTIILNYDLQTYVPAPMDGATPVKKIEDRADMTVTVVWKDAGGNDITATLDTFADDTVYKADITLTTKPGYAFDTTISFKYPNGWVTDQPNDNTAAMSRDLSTVTYKKTVAPTDIPTPVDLTSLIPVPVTGGSPVTNFSTETYGGTVAWAPAPSGLFGAGTGYTAKVTLYPAPGYVFPGAFPTSVSVTHSGTSLPITAFTHGSDGTVWGDIAFDKTGLVLQYAGLFSGETSNDKDSAIDAIRAARAAGFNSLSLSLFPWTETVDLTAGKDIGEGLELTTANSPAIVILDGGGRTIKLATNSTGPIITVGAGVKLTLRNITFEGHSGNSAALIVVVAGGELVTEDGAVLMSNTNKNGNTGGGVYMTGGTFTMNGGAISGNSTSTNGGGVYVYVTSGANATFNMNGGTIGGSNVTIGGENKAIGGNNAANGGGVYVYGANVTFTMSGGTIGGNNAANGGGVFMSNATFTMEGGIISGNKATSRGGGVLINGTSAKFTMSGGVIYGSEAANGDKKNTGNNGAAFFKNGGTTTLATTNNTLNFL
jgi:hypothetical protein